jgi:hypothetical protein
MALAPQVREQGRLGVERGSAQVLGGRQGGSVSRFCERPDPLDAAMGEADDVLEKPPVSGRIQVVDADVRVNRPLDLALRASPAASRMTQQSAVAGDRVNVEQALQA